jgi:hypothetical protein
MLLPQQTQEAWRSKSTILAGMASEGVRPSRLRNRFCQAFPRDRKAYSPPSNRARLPMFFQRLPAVSLPRGEHAPVHARCVSTGAVQRFPYETDIIQYQNHFDTKSFSCQSEWTLGVFREGYVVQRMALRRLTPAPSNTSPPVPAPSLFVLV